MRVAGLVGVLAFVGCGSQKGGTAPTGPSAAAPSPAVYAVASAGALPACDDAHRGQVLYVESDEHFVVCHATGWEPIDLRGPAGADGKDAAEESFIKASIHCGGELASTGIWFSYEAAVMKAGEVFANGSIRNATIEASQTSFFAPTQNGAATAAVSVEFDLLGASNGGYWTLELNRTTLVTTITNFDVDAPGGQNAWTMTSDKCVTNTY